MVWWKGAKKQEVTKITVNGKETTEEASWSWAGLSFNTVWRSATFATFTCFEVLKQGLALRTSIPSLINGKHSQKIWRGVQYVASSDLLFLLSIYYGNDLFQKTAAGYADDYGNYALNIIDAGAKTLFYQRGMQAFLHLQTLLSLAAMAYKADSPIESNKCLKDACEGKGFTSGMLREPVIIWANKGIVWAIQFVPYVGPMLHPVMYVAVHGRIVSRLINYDICERHRLPSLPQEYIVGLGITHALLLKLLDYAFEKTVGTPNFLILMVVQSLVLLLHLNLAAHVPVKTLPSEDRTIPYDPLDAYDALCRGATEFVFNGTTKVIAIYTRPEEGVPPLIPITAVFKGLTQLLNSDRETTGLKEVGFFSRNGRAAVKHILPPMLRDLEQFTTDPIISMYWPNLTNKALGILSAISRAGKSNTASVLSVSTSVSAYFIQILFGIPPEATKTFLSWCNEKEFWEFNQALKDFLERHQLGKPLLQLTAPKGITPLHGEPRAAVPEENLPPVSSLSALQPHSEEARIGAGDLVSSECEQISAGDLLPADEGMETAWNLLPQ